MLLMYLCYHNLWLRALFDYKADDQAITAKLKQTVENIDCSIETVEDQDWVRLTQQQFQPQCYADRLWICPAHHNPAGLTGDIVMIDPGLAFGTGTHPTTALCLTWLAEHDLQNKTVIDYGCGSGILALAAITLGAKQVWAIDHDPQAIIATENNAALNPQLNQNLYIGLPESLPDIQADIVVANILAKPLIELKSEISNHLAVNSQLILSGLLDREAEQIKSHYSDLNFIDMQQQDEWILLAFSNQ